MQIHLWFHTQTFLGKDQVLQRHQPAPNAVIFCENAGKVVARAI
jgi:hypothetical protein